MKRYRVQNFSFDSRASILAMEIREEWEDKVKALHKENHQKVRNGLIEELGIQNFAQKEQDLIAIGPAFPSVVAFHNKFLFQIRQSFVMGNYYPALTGATTLIERVLNHLVIKLRGDFKHAPEYKDVYNKNSFTDWGKLIQVLMSWKILLPDTQPYLEKLKTLRHQYAAHFSPETDLRDRELALEAIDALQEFIKIQFGVIGNHPWFIPNSHGDSFIKKEYENDPFVKAIYLPNCIWVGPKFKFADKTWDIIDEEYEEKDITDEEFLELRELSRHSKQ